MHHTKPKTIRQTIYNNFVLASTTAFIMLGMYAYDQHAGNPPAQDLGAFIDQQLRDYKPKTLSQRQIDALRYLYDEQE